MSDNQETVPATPTFKEIYGVGGAPNAILLKVTDDSGLQSAILRVVRPQTIMAYNEVRTGDYVDWKRTSAFLTQTAPGPATERYGLCDMGFTLYVQPFGFDCYDYLQPNGEGRAKAREKVMQLVRATLKERAPQMHAVLEKWPTHVVFTDEYMREVFKYGEYKAS